MRTLSLTILLFLTISFIGVASGFPCISQINQPTFFTGDQGKNYTDSIQFKIIDGINHSYGYDIYLHDRLLIHQPSMPCIQGNKGFSKKSDAKKVAVFVREKIRKGEMPPTITLQEMKKLGVVN